jgi:hypothetical protein
VTTRLDVENLQLTRTERLLALVLTAFLLLGGIWTYTRVDDAVRSHVRLPTATVTQAPAIVRENTARLHLVRAEDRSRTALRDLGLKREAYRTALEAHKPSGRLERQYNAAQASYSAAQRDVRSARRELFAAAPAANAAQRRAQQKVGAVLHRQARDAFLIRLGLVVLSIGFAYWLLSYMRRRQTRWFPFAGSAVGFATIFAFVLAADYVTDYFNPFQWGVAVVALIGIVATLLAYLVLQRYLLRRVPQRRVRRRECPFCGYPVGTNAHCEGCGREVVAPCASCEAPRRVGTSHCGACGATS